MRTQTSHKHHVCIPHNDLLKILSQKFRLLINIRILEFPILGYVGPSRIESITFTRLETTMRLESRSGCNFLHCVIKMSRLWKLQHIVRGGANQRLS